MKNETTANIQIISVLHISSNLYLKANTNGLKFIIYVSLLYNFLLKYCCIHSLCTLCYMLRTFIVFHCYMLHTFIVLHYVTCYTHSLMLLVFINHNCLSALHKATLHYWLIDWLIDCFMLLHVSDLATFIYLESELTFALFVDTLSQQGHLVSCMTLLISMLANHQIWHRVTHKTGCQPGDCRWPLKSSTGVCVGMYLSPAWVLYHVYDTFTFFH